MQIDFSKLKLQQQESEDSQWLPVSDLMSGLMILFLFIAVSFILNAKRVADNYQDNQEKIYQALQTEFSPKLKDWKAKIDKDTLTFIFTDPEVLFETGRSDLNAPFKKILDDFFPRYMKVVDNYKTSISEIRIEGHTSTEWDHKSSDDMAYFLNMQLSQDRTRSVLIYLYQLENIAQYRDWIKSNLSAVGLSSSKTIKNTQGIEDKEASKRVTFRIITNAEEQLRKLSEIK
ncbi:OmpA family protein [Actinobacillus pleuropneumoniae]|uniref:OmpA n=1 Tax=Actinobacillus pleuropneumoniae TaxID=715 RepID=B4XH93_ACTPL|nr:OmpA family protein [Actinobacillus pleuropneumoniae]ABV82725.1 OmpA [Actinobacillus pleuropneumoniae]ASU15016.1 hypothetical protein CHY23_00203 [Actinobacillus pleuropneumoniae]AWG95621.1 cell envelope biogenesis protein OmpA [Actinobacillus pleuropneumoniae serovar 1 str. 4074]AXA21691.1 OmpA family protein [Actinobacillus pleuropneumoniae]EFM93935.1 hypothetical protein appser9_13200 [Actinobacillus pleuropneumoniae serovar 9 str. CVJ13261]